MSSHDWTCPLCGSNYYRTGTAAGREVRVCRGVMHWHRTAGGYTPVYEGCVYREFVESVASSSGATAPPRLTPNALKGIEVAFGEAGFGGRIFSFPDASSARRTKP